MRIGLMVMSANPVATPEYLTALAEASEEGGFASLWVGEHAVLFDEYTSSNPYSSDGRISFPNDSGLLDPFATLSFLAAVTTTVRLGTAVCILPQRNPVQTAKEVATVDWLSGGRVDFGIGVGWLREEFDALGVPFTDRADR